MDLKSKTAALALGSGAARGLAHIGVIRVLEQAGIKIGGIAGSSMGALIGGIYAAGKLHDYEDWVIELNELDVLRLLDITWGTQAGLLKGDSIIAALKALIGDHRIEDLSMPFTAVATDIKARREVWLERGSLFEAIRASIAIPGVFRPAHKHKRVLLDGGLLNPVPIAPTLAYAADLIVAVSVTAPPEPHPPAEHRRGRRAQAPSTKGYRERIEAFMSSLQEALASHNVDDPSAAEDLSLIDVILESLETMQQTITRFKLAAYQPDLLIEVPANVCQAHEFYRAKEIIEAGERWARQALADWEEAPRNLRL